MMTLSKKIANILFGKTGELNGEINVLNNFSHPNGDKFEWNGYEGLIYYFYKRIEQLEEKINKKGK